MSFYDDSTVILTLCLSLEEKNTFWVKFAHLLHGETNGQ